MVHHGSRSGLFGVRSGNGVSLILTRVLMPVLKSAGREETANPESEGVVTVVGGVGVTNRRSTVLGSVVVRTAAFGLPALTISLAILWGVLLVPFGGVSRCYRG